MRAPEYRAQRRQASVGPKSRHPVPTFRSPPSIPLPRYRLETPFFTFFDASAAGAAGGLPPLRPPMLNCAWYDERLCHEPSARSLRPMPPRPTPAPRLFLSSVLLVLLVLFNPGIPTPCYLYARSPHKTHKTRQIFPVLCPGPSKGSPPRPNTGPLLAKTVTEITETKPPKPDTSRALDSHAPERFDRGFRQVRPAGSSSGIGKLQPLRASAFAGEIAGTTGYRVGAQHTARPTNNAVDDYLGSSHTPLG
jgi:hypothetical protein